MIEEFKYCCGTKVIYEVTIYLKEDLDIEYLKKQKQQERKR